MAIQVIKEKSKNETFCIFSTISDSIIVENLNKMETIRYLNKLYLMDYRDATLLVERVIRGERVYGQFGMTYEEVMIHSYSKLS